ncbi:MAG: hypothetical protein KDC26_02375 [Armatimonadetes bacterium]|nr:hypothetical protein [Armatimonadota bacterium]
MKATAVVGLASLALFAFAMLGRYEARMSGEGGKGKAKMQSKQKRGEYQAEFEVEGENMLSDASYWINVDGQSFLVNTNAFGSFEFSARYSSPDHPNIEGGTPINITNGAGDVVMQGVFQQR